MLHPRNTLPQASRHVPGWLSLSLHNPSGEHIRRVWVNSSASMLALGWVSIAPICGALDWRPHIFVNGPKATGKSTLIDCFAEMLKPMAIVVDGTSTEAGIRQSIGADSRPVILDEFESDRQLNRMQSVLKLARSSSSAKGPIARGTPEGKALQFMVHSTFCFGAINPIAGTSADASRIVELELQPHDNDQKRKEEIDSLKRYLSERVGAWPHQMVSLAEEILDCIKVFNSAMPAGQESRHRDNMATLLGGAFTALNKRKATPEEAVAWINEHMPFIDYLAMAHEEDDSQDCLNHLLCSKYGDHVVGDYLCGKAFTQTPEGGIDVSNGDIGQNVLQNMGIRLVDGGFLVANRHPELTRIFQGTLWARATGEYRYVGCPEPSLGMTFGHGSLAAARSAVPLFHSLP